MQSDGVTRTLQGARGRAMSRVFVILIVAVVGMVVGGVAVYLGLSSGHVTPKAIAELPADYRQELDRFTLVNTATGETVKEFKVLGKAAGAYVEGGTVYESYVVGFEDRYGGAEVDLDFLDVIVEMKQARASDAITVRIVQLGSDIIDVYLDDRFLGRIRPAIEIQIQRQAARSER